MSREQVPDAYKWNLDVLFASEGAFEQGLKEADQGRQRLGAFTGKLTRPKNLYECLEVYFKTRLLTNKLTLYANQKFDSNQTSTSLQAMNDRALGALNALIQKAAFIRQEVLVLDEPAMNAAFRSDPRLVAFKPYLVELRRRKAHVVGPEAERTLGLAGDNLWAEIDLNEIPSDHEKAFRALLADMKLPSIQDDTGKRVQLTLSNYTKYRSNPDRRVRKDTVEALFGTLRQSEHALAADLGGQIRFNVFLARARGYETARDAYLDKDNISPAVYDNLLRTANANLKPLHRYMSLRKRIMGLPELRIHDLYTPLVPTAPMRFTFDDATRILPQALSPLGPDYLNLLREGLDPKHGWLDLYPHRNKASGAFSSSVYGIHPFVKMNYYEGLDDLSTLAHEYGHAMHSRLSMDNQPYVTANYTSFIAEIASTFNEKLLSDYLLSRSQNDQERLFLLTQMIDKIRTTIYRQALFAEFEYEAHTAAEKGLPLTAEFFNKTYARLLRTYYGPELSLGKDDEVEWAYIPHFYYKYYVFSYASGFSAGIALAERVRQSGVEARDAYLGMLKGGSSKAPLQLLKDAGVDLTTPHAIEQAAKLLNNTLDDLERILAKK